MTGNLIGTVVRIHETGFGFIAGDSRQVYFHHSVVEWIPFSQLKEGQVVEYELADGRGRLHFGYPGGPQAIAVRPV